MLIPFPSKTLMQMREVEATMDWLAHNREAQPFRGTGEQHDAGRISVR